MGDFDDRLDRNLDKMASREESDPDAYLRPREDPFDPTERAVIDRAVRWARDNVPGGRSVALFGSRARDGRHGRSDFDFFAVGAAGDSHDLTYRGQSVQVIPVPELPLDWLDGAPTITVWPS